MRDRVVDNIVAAVQRTNVCSLVSDMAHKINVLKLEAQCVILH